MEKVLKLYEYIDGVNDSPFPSASEQVVITSFRYDAKRMGNAPTITFTFTHDTCLDNTWNRNVYAFFNGERYYLKQTPTSSYSNTDTRYKHEVELVSERMILDNIYFYDVVQKNTDVDKPVSNSSKFAFFGDVKEYVSRLDASLSWSKVDYNIVIDDGIFSEEKQVSFENQVITVALQEIYNIYKIPYYFVGKTIHVGTYQESIDHVFKYGVENSLLSITKGNTSAKIINRITGVGSSDNIPYYYPNDDEKGVTIPLLNGSTSGVEISNASKYRKVRLSDKFNFSSTLQSRTPLIDASQYTLGDLRYDLFKDNKTQYSLDFQYSFTLNQQEDVEFVVKTVYPDSIDLRYEIYKTSGSHLGYFSGVNKLSLASGTYNLIIRWRFLHEDSIIPIEEYLPALIERMQIEADIVVDAENTWTLKGVPVSLSNYGLSVSNPSNGDVVSIKQISYINTQPSLMPPIYRDSSGNERFYNAKNNTFVDKNGVYYTFDNEYSNSHPREHIENFEDIRPTIKNVTNSEGYHIDRFVDFAYDLYDNDEVDENNEYIHKYFYAKLNKFDGTWGFNLFDHAIDEDEMVISMTSGSCGSCSFKIMVNKDTQKNTVQVDDYGNLLRDSNGNVRFGTPQDRQNDTINNQVWIALEKDIDTFGVLMPNATNNYRPIAGDTFVILHIDLPKEYITSAEERLKDELIKYMFENNFEKFNFSISFSRIFFAEHPEILQRLSENSKLRVEYNKTTYDLFVSSLSYYITNDNPLPEIKVDLDDAITISQNQINQIVESTKKEILSSTKKDVFWMDIKGIPSWITSEKPRYSYSELYGSASLGDSMWSVKEDVNGTKYLYTVYPIVTQLGLTTFTANEELILESIYDGLVIDNQTIYWEDIKEEVGTDEEGNPIYKTTKVLKAKGGGSGEGTIKDVVINVEGNANAITDVKLSDDKTGLVFTKGLEFAERKYVDDTLKGYLPLTGGTMLGSINMSVGSVIKWGDNASLIGQNENLYITSKKQLFIATGKTGNTISPKAAIAANGNMGIAGSLLVGQAGYSTSHTLYVKGNSLFEGSISSGSVYPRIDNLFSLGSENLRFNNAYIQNICIGKTEINEYQEGVLRIEGNLLVTGGITAFADQYSSTSIMDALVCDEQTITVEEVDGVKTLKVICETGNSIDEEALKGIIDGYGFLTEVKAKDSYLGKNDMAASASKAKFDFDNNEISTTYLKVVDAERRFVTTDTEQIIEVKKNFKGGLFVNGGEIKYNGSYWQFDGDLLVTGGITAFADRYSSTSIMDAIVCDEQTITVEEVGGVKTLKVIGGGSGGGVDEEVVKDIIDSYLTGDKLPVASTSSKGIASFDSKSFNVSSGHVTFNGGKVKVVTSTPSTYESNTLYVIVG